MINDLEKYIDAKLQAMQSEKAERLKDVEPKWITKAEFFSAVDKDVRVVLNKLFHEKKIRVHKTIHATQNDYIEYLNREENGETVVSQEGE